MALMKGNVIDGKAVAEQCRTETAAVVKRLKEEHGKTPGLAVIIVGERKDSQTYVRMKEKACADVGIRSFKTALPADVPEATLLATIRRYNWNADVHGILVQLPLPKHIDEKRVLSAVALEKDVDGFHPQNVGELCMKLLERVGIDAAGKRAVVVGRSNIVGMPAAMLLNKRDATVTICHSRTPEMDKVVKDADIVIAAAGKAGMIKGSWLKKGAVLIDVGTNSVDDASKKSGYRLVGDADFESCSKVASAITPVPGGVGPMTIAMLLHNTVESAKKSATKKAGCPIEPLQRWGSAAIAAAAVAALGVCILRGWQQSK